jgi:hypothetical protein
MAIGSFFPYGTGYTAGQSPQVLTLATIVADSNQTLTVPQMMGGFIRRTLTATARTDTTPTAAALVAALPQDLRQVGGVFFLEITRTDAAAVALTIAGGTGVTVTGTATIAASTNRTFLCYFTNVTSGSEAITLYSLGASLA